MRAVRERDGGQGVRVSPFRGLRFRCDGAELARALCPPYDVVEPERRADLVARDPHNVVRLTLPEATDAAAAGRTLRRWVDEGVLAVDPEPALYVLEQRLGGRRWRGVVGAVHLAGAADGSVLPHEDVIPAVVAGRQALLAELETDLEPLLLTVDGGLGDVVGGLVQAGEVVATTSLGGTDLTLWQVVDEAAHRRVDEALAGRRALIADGHHRWTAAERHGRRVRERRGPGPWDRCLALVVDAASHPLELSAIHRVVEGVDVAAARGAWTAAGSWSSAPAEPARLADVVARSAPGAIGVTDGRAGWLLRSRPVGDQLAVEWLHEELLPRAGVGEGAVGYHHDVHDAVSTARRLGGVAVVCAPVPLSAVRQRAAAGRRMPRKATSFGPKPPSGLVMRRHIEE